MRLCAGCLGDVAMDSSRFPEALRATNRGGPFPGNLESIF